MQEPSIFNVAPSGMEKAHTFWEIPRFWQDLMLNGMAAFEEARLKLVSIVGACFLIKIIGFTFNQKHQKAIRTGHNGKPKQKCSKKPIMAKSISVPVSITRDVMEHRTASGMTFTIKVVIFKNSILQASKKSFSGFE